MVQPHFARGYLHDLRLPAVAVDDQQLAKSCPIDRLANLVHGRQQSLARQRHGAWKVRMLFGFSVCNRCHGERRHMGWQPLQRMADHAGADDAVYSTRQARSVLLGSPHGSTITVFSLSGSSAISV